MNITPHFTQEEADCRDGTAVPVEYMPNVLHVFTQLEVLRAAVGEPINCNDVYRSPAHNKAVGGAPNSQHLIGKACDFWVNGMTSTEVHTKIEELIAEGKMEQGGLGLYPTFCHYDVRGHKARWNG